MLKTDLERMDSTNGMLFDIFSLNTIFTFKKDLRQDDQRFFGLNLPNIQMIIFQSNISILSKQGTLIGQIDIPAFPKNRENYYEIHLATGAFPFSGIVVHHCG